MENQQEDFSTSGTLSRYDDEASWGNKRWHENYGNILIVCFVTIAIAGFAMLIYRDNRFVAPRFPDGNVLTQPFDAEETIAGEEDGSESAGLAEPNQVEPTEVEPTQVETKEVESTKVEPKDTEPTKVEPKDTEPTKVEPKDTEPTKIEPKEAE